MGDEAGCFFLSSSKTVLSPTAASRGSKFPLELEERNLRKSGLNLSLKHKAGKDTSSIL